MSRKELKTKFMDRLIEKVAQEQTQRTEQEVKAAWRAGYDYLHHCERLHSSRGYKERYRASNSEKPPSPYGDYGSSWVVRTYELRWLFPEDVKAIERGEIDE